jgi:RNA polymerase sigma factor for flagellar operon FliA
MAGSVMANAMAEADGLPCGTEIDRERMLLEHLPSVRFIARRLHQKLPQHVELEDLISAGTVGLMDACSRFDPGRHVQFKSFAQFRIRGAILDSLRQLDWSPRELRRKGRAVDEAGRRLTQRLGREPLQQEIAAEMELTLKQLQQLLGELDSLAVGSLHAENEDTSLQDMDRFASTADEDPLFLCLQGETRQHLANAIERLPEKERLVLTLYYYEELTMNEIGLILGVVESRVSQIRSSAVGRLRNAFGLAPVPGKRPSRARTAAGRTARRLSAA